MLGGFKPRLERCNERLNIALDIKEVHGTRYFAPLFTMGIAIDKPRDVSRLTYPLDGPIPILNGIVRIENAPELKKANILDRKSVV